MIDDNAMNTFIKQVAGNVARNFPSYVDSDDVTSVLWVWYMENEHSVTKMIHDNPESWGAMLYGTMVRVASTYAIETEADTHGYSVDDLYFYSTPVVRELLKDAFDYENWQSFQSFGDGQPKSKRQSATSDRIDMLIDVKSAVEGLSLEQQELIYWRFEYQFEYDHIAEALEISEEAARKRVERAVGAVRKALGKKPLSDMSRGFSGRTEARMNTAQALSYQENIY